MPNKTIYVSERTTCRCTRRAAGNSPATLSSAISIALRKYVEAGRRSRPSRGTTRSPCGVGPGDRPPSKRFLLRAYCSPRAGPVPAKNGYEAFQESIAGRTGKFRPARRPPQTSFLTGGRRRAVSCPGWRSLGRQLEQ